MTVESYNSHSADEDDQQHAADERYHHRYNDNIINLSSATAKACLQLRTTKYQLARLMLLLLLMYCFARWRLSSLVVVSCRRLSSVVVCNAAGGRAGRPPCA